MRKIKQQFNQHEYALTIGDTEESYQNTLSTSLSNKGPDGSMNYVVGLPNNSYKPIASTTWVRARFCKLQKGCTRLAAASDKVYQLLTHGRWFSPVSATIKADHHDIAESGVKHTKKYIVLGGSES